MNHVHNLDCLRQLHSDRILSEGDAQGFKGNWFVVHVPSFGVLTLPSQPDVIAAAFPSRVSQT